MSGQLPVPPSSSVHVIGSPTATEVGTTFAVKVNWPTAPPKSAGAPSGRGLMVSAGSLLATVCCTMSGAEKGKENRLPVVLTTSTTSCEAAGIR